MTPAGVPAIELSGRAVVVAGAGGGGIGTAVATTLLDAAATVVAVDVRPDAMDALPASRGSLVTVVADVRDPHGVAAVVAALRAVDATPYGLVNVVGSQNPDDFTPLLDETPDNWHRVFSLNVDYIPFLSGAIVRLLAESGSPGAIVNLATISAFGGAPNHAGHGASKAAVLSLTQSMADEWGRLAVRVNAVAPGAIDVPHFHSTPATAGFDRDVIPLGRRGRATEVAAVVAFLLSDLAAYVTGQWIGVDGGLNTRLAFIGGDNLPVFVDDPSIRARCAPS